MNIEKIRTRIGQDSRFGAIAGISPLAGGLVNESYLLSGARPLIVQKINSGLSRNQLTDYLEFQDIFNRNRDKHCARIPNMIFHWEDEDGAWKVSEYIEHDRSIGLTDASAKSAAYHMGKVHRILESCSFTPRFSIPGFHDSAAIFEKLRAYAAGGKFADAAPDALAFKILRMRPEASLAEAPRQLIHADPKFQNWLFDSHEEAIALIDWDTLMLGNPLIDIGDMMRSMCKGANGMFDRNRFMLMADTYRKGSLSSMRDREMLGATKLITLELAARFLIDCAEDYYFSYDQAVFPTRHASNCTAAHKYALYAETIC